MTNKKYPHIIYLRVLIIILVLIGVIAQQLSSFFKDHGGYVALFYFTTQSNIFLLVINVFLLRYELRQKEKPAVLLTLEHIAISAVTLTFIVFALLLGPFVELATYFYSVTNVTLHNAAPILGIITYLMTREQSSKKPYYALSSGLFYLVFAYTVYFIRGNFGPTEFPYFFLDFKTNGWLTFSPPQIGVIYYFVFIFFLLLSISYALIKLKNRENTKRTVKITAMTLATLSIVINLINVLWKL